MQKRLTITLDEYVKYGGDLSKVALSPIKTTYGDKNQGKMIDTISLGELRHHTYPAKSSTQLYKVVFVDGTEHEYAGSWIEVSVDFVLDQKYK